MPRLEKTAQQFNDALLDLIGAAMTHDHERAGDIAAGIVAAYTQAAALIEVDLNKMSAELN